MIKLLSDGDITGLNLGYMKNALVGVLNIAMYTTPTSAFFI